MGLNITNINLPEQIYGYDWNKLKIDILCGWTKVWVPTTLHIVRIWWRSRSAYSLNSEKLIRTSNPTPKGTRMSAVVFQSIVLTIHFCVVQHGRLPYERPILCLLHGRLCYKGPVELHVSNGHCYMDLAILVVHTAFLFICFVKSFQMDSLLLFSCSSH